MSYERVDIDLYTDQIRNFYNQEEMTEEEIRSLQSGHDEFIVEMQALLDSGEAWSEEHDDIGDEIAYSLEIGECFLPDTTFINPVGSIIPSRSDLYPGTPGTLEWASTFYCKIFN